MQGNRGLTPITQVDKNFHSVQYGHGALLFLVGFVRKTNFAKTRGAATSDAGSFFTHYSRKDEKLFCRFLNRYNAKIKKELPMTSSFDKYLITGAMINSGTEKLLKEQYRNEVSVAHKNLENKEKENEDLKRENKNLRDKISEQEKAIIRQKEFLKEWMISQIAFKNLFKKYARMPDGRTMAEMTEDEKLKLIEDEEEIVMQENPKLRR